MHDEDKICQNCFWYARHPSGNHGYCKYLPPVFTHIDDRGFAKYQNPTVSTFNWCSKWIEGED